MTILLFLSGYDVFKDDIVMNVDDKEKSGPVKTDTKSEDNNDACSPYCQCVRCPFAIMLPQKQFMIIAYRPLEIKFSISIAGNPRRISSSVCQPPKVG